MVSSLGIVLTFVFCLLSSTILAGGIGVTPSTLEISDALRGGAFLRTITVFNPGDGASAYTFNVTGNAADWISFYEKSDPLTPITRITVPGKGSAKILVRFNIPEDASNGKHEASLFVATATVQGDEDSSGQTIKLGMPVAITIMVTGTQVLTGTVLSITTMDTEMNYPLRLKVEFQNTGNVIAKPEIAVEITKDGTVIDEFTHSDRGVNVDSKAFIPVEWDTTGRESGDYGAQVTVSLGEKVLATKKLSFKLLPVGTLSRQGDLSDITYEGRPLVGTTVKILAPFVNTGEIDTTAKFIGEVYVDGTLIDTIDSVELLVPVRETVTLKAYLKLETPGSYTIKGHAVYDGKTTSTKALSFEAVSEPKTESQSKQKSKPLLEIPDCGALGAVLAIASVSGYLLYRKRAV